MLFIDKGWKITRGTAWVEAFLFPVRNRCFPYRGYLCLRFAASAHTPAKLVVWKQKTLLFSPPPTSRRRDNLRRLVLLGKFEVVIKEAVAVVTDCHFIS